MAIRVTVTYVARLREQRGRSGETLETEAATPAALYRALRERHGFTDPPAALRVAVNDRLAGWDTPLGNNDAVLFLPPVSGG